MIKQILIPVEDVSAAADFYASQFGFAVKFKDGTRYAALDAGTVTLALVAQAEDLTAGHVSFSIQVDDVDLAAANAEKAGATLLSAPHDGPHERRAVIEDVGGHAVVLYSKA